MGSLSCSCCMLHVIKVPAFQTLSPPQHCNRMVQDGEGNKFPGIKSKADLEAYLRAHGKLLCQWAVSNAEVGEVACLPELLV